MKQVHAGLQAFNRRDLEAATARFHPEIEWIAGADLVPDAAVYHGREGVMEFWRTWFETMENFRLEVEETLDLGDGRVLLVTRASGSGKDSGVPVEARFAQVWEIRDGLAVRAQMYASREAALEAEGLEPGSVASKP